MTLAHEKVIRCIGLLGSAIRCLATACVSDCVAPMYVSDALDYIHTALQTLLDYGEDTH